MIMDYEKKYKEVLGHAKRAIENIPDESLANWLKMTQEEKELLLKDLCARLPYGVIIDSKTYNEANYRRHYLQRLLTIRAVRESVVCVDVDDYPDPKCREYALEHCKPYLRPMSSMTEEEVKEYDMLSRLDDEYAQPYDSIHLVDWLNSHHFDYRGLIEKGLALEAPEDMYKEL